MTTPSNPSTDAEPSTPTSKPRRVPEWVSRVPKTAWIALSAGFAVLALVLALVPIVGSAIARNNAVEDLTAANSAVGASDDDLAAAEQELLDARTAASTAHAETALFVTEVRAELLADPASLEALTGSLAELLDLTSLELDDAGVAATPTATDPQPATETPETPESTEEILALTDEQLAAAETLTAKAAALRKTADAINEQRESLAGLIDAVLASGAAFGAAVTGMDKADETSRQGLSTAVTALGEQEVPPAERFAAFAAAYDAVKGSHDAIVAAEQAAAEAAAAEEARRQAGSSGGSYRGGSSGGGSSGRGGSGGFCWSAPQ